MLSGYNCVRRRLAPIQLDPPRPQVSKETLKRKELYTRANTMVTAKDTITPDMKIGNNDPAPGGASGKGGSGSGNEGAGSSNAGSSGAESIGSGSGSAEGGGMVKKLSTGGSQIFGQKAADDVPTWPDFDPYAKHPDEHPLMPEEEK
jgi:hypothetical protein